eukprot:TRINITY_DN1775_c0_g1_i1.p1 TRINITY_DN1775_c0_g1~~TRINITY_DN1775_c0_g1_i1.p1  ORF type:complete len:330 (-),score=33.42 TRINITY_DN1775_c0_g1_i1:42-1031(-)
MPLLKAKIIRSEKMLRAFVFVLILLSAAASPDGWKHRGVFGQHHCIKTMKGILKYSCINADDLVPCINQFQSRVEPQCEEIFNKTVVGLTSCQPEIKQMCDGQWGLGALFKTPVHCLAASPANLTSQCLETELMGFALRMLSPHHRPRCMMFGWMLGFVVVASGIVWVVMEKRRRAKARIQRWEAEHYKPTAQGSWSTGLFGSWKSCLPHWPTCFPSFFWPACQQAITQSEMRDRNCNIGDVCTNLTWAQRFANIFHTRQELRSRLDMPEAPVRDCLAAALCQPCVLAQHARELDIRQTVAVPQYNAAYAPQVGVPLVESWQPSKEAIV